MACQPHPLRRISRALFVMALLFGISTPVRATWSIVVVDRRTGEVGVACATCLAGFPLRDAVALIAVGKGAAAAQSSIDTGATNRMRMWNTMHAGASADRILQDVIWNGTMPHRRQYGIVTMAGPPVGWSGTQAGFGKCETFTVVGDLAYSIQGNLLTGPAVCYEAERALLNTPGDLSQKLMAAMEAARAMGGDGRCSCNGTEPDRCGAPPDEFTKSAHTAFIVLARMGDGDGVCNGGQGCANGDYYLTLDEIGGGGGLDPVLGLQRQYDRWRAVQRGKPDHLLTTVEAGSDRLVANGMDHTDVVVRLFDLENELIDHGGQQLVLTYTGSDPPAAVAGPVIDVGDGTHLFEVTATTDPGQASWRIEVVQGARSIQLHPALVIEVDPQ